MRCDSADTDTRVWSPDRRPCACAADCRGGRRCWLCLLAVPAPAIAQVDPLIGLKRLPPNCHRRPRHVADDARSTATATTTTSRRIRGPMTRRSASSLGLSRQHAVPAHLLRACSTRRRRAARASTSPRTSWRSQSTAQAATRPSGHRRASKRPRRGIAQAVLENPGLVRWGLLKLRQNNAWLGATLTNSTGCDKPVRVTDNASLNHLRYQSLLGGRVARPARHLRSVDKRAQLRADIKPR